MTEKSITIIIGPTAIGKTDYAIDLAKKTGAQIISADAFQVYRGMDIGTAKVSVEIRAQIPHHLIDIKNPDETYAVTEFKEKAENIVNDLKKQNIPIIICGGTAFYINAFLHDYSFINTEPDPKLREKLTQKAQEIGSIALWRELAKIDEKAAQIIEPQNQRRVIRALEIYEQTKTKPSELRQKSSQMRSDVQIIGLTAERSLIYDRINQRVDWMYKNGLIEEVENLLKKGYTPDLLSFEALGYRLTGQYLNGSITKEEMLESLKIKTRHFAKRQLTWFRKFTNVYWIKKT